MRISELNGLLLPFLKRNANAIRSKGGAAGEFPAYQQPEKIANIGGGMYLHHLTGINLGSDDEYVQGEYYIINASNKNYSSDWDDATGIQNMIDDHKTMPFYFIPVGKPSVANYGTSIGIGTGEFLSAAPSASSITFPYFGGTASGSNLTIPVSGGISHCAVSVYAANKTCHDTVTAI